MESFDWRDWHYAKLVIRIRRRGVSAVVDFDCDDGDGGSGGYTKIPPEVKAKILRAVEEFVK